MLNDGPHERRQTTVLIVDDNPLVGKAMERWFGLSGDFRWAGWLPSPEGLDEAMARRSPRVVLVDWHMPGVDTAALLRRLSAAYPEVCFAVLSAHLDADIVRAALQAGACGYLAKNQSPAALAMEVTMLARGRMVLSPEARASLRLELDAGT